MVLFAVVTALAMSNAVFVYLYRSTVNEYSHFKSAVEAESEALRLENERKLQALVDANRQVADDYAKARAALAARKPVVRVQRETCSDTGILPTVPVAVEGLDATTEVGTVSTEQCEAIANDGIQDAQQLIWLQHWITQQHEAGR
jgi:hypothetical protein